MREYGEKYYLGLDLGTNSIGWALTDENYNLRRAKGKDTWGARLFDEANPSVERRTHRAARRRSQREKARIALLKDYFCEEINKIDPGFYLRLEESKYHIEDRTENNRQKYALFTGEYTDEDYFKKYPTIFHLRKALIENKEAPYDVRLVFLALLNMYKHRGNFLNSSLNTEMDISDMTSAWKEFVDTAELFSISLPADKADAIELCLSEKGVSRSKIVENIVNYLGFTKKDKRECGLIDLLAGKTVKLINIYGSEIIDEEHKTLSVCFRDSNYDENEQKIREYLDEQYFVLIESAKVVHDLGLLSNIMKGQQYLTFARVESYETHKKDLLQLKNLLMKYDMDAYNKLFREMSDGNYSAYVGSVYSHNKKIRRNEGKGRKQEDLYKTIKKILEKLPQEDEDVKNILAKVEAEIFLPKQLTSANGVIPNQIYVSEMKKILENAETYLSFLKEKDESGLSVSDRILELFTFRVPYYVGPLGQEYADKNGYNVWSVRRNSGRILPWNFEQKIDLKTTAEKFIERMVRKCSYLSEERTLPKNSLLYQKYMVLNELNNLRVNGEKISVEEKQDIFRTLFSSGKKVTVKQLERYFINRGKVSADAKDFLSGIDTEGGFKSSLSTYDKFYRVFGENIKLDEYQNIAENIVFWITVYGDDKKFVKERIVETYSEKVSEAQIKKILGFKFTDWGNLSKEFLELQEEENIDGLSIIQAMWDTNENLMELLSSEHGYKSALESKCKKMTKELAEWTIDDLDDMYVSAPVKRMIWQTIRITKELCEITGHEPNRIFVEMARQEGEKKRTNSRKKKLLDLYSAIKGEEKEWKKDIEQKQEADFRSKKLYLYYLQMGRCMYSGQVIDLQTLLTDNTAYDIDHIYPRHFIKDDSIENNLVLVKKEINAAKTDNYPLDDKIRNSQQVFWRQLKEKGFITAEKYNRLTRVMPFSDDEKAAFISRQLVETRQGTKVVTEILKQAFPNSTIVFSKAGEVSEFRKKYDMIKVRCVNDLHHAKDAYLNIVVGNTYYVKFTANPLRFIKDANRHGQDDLYKYHMDKIFEYDVKRDGEIAWIGTGKGSSTTLNIVKNTMNKNTVLITKRAYVAHGGITGKDTVYKAVNASKNPLAYLAMSNDERLKDVTKYGGRMSISTQCYCLVGFKVNGKSVLSLEALPVYIGNIQNISEDVVLNYLKEALQAEYKNKVVTQIELKYKCIRFNSLMKIDGHWYHLGGKTDTMICLKNAIPLIVNYKWEIYIKKIEKALNLNYYEELDKDGNVVISAEDNIRLYEYICDKIDNVFGSKKSSIISTIKSGKELFGTLTINEQCFTLMQIINWLGLNCITTDLTKIGGSAKSGYCRLGKKINICKEAVLINQSCTGLLSTTINLLSL